MITLLECCQVLLVKTLVEIFCFYSIYKVNHFSNVLANRHGRHNFFNFKPNYPKNIPFFSIFNVKVLALLTQGHSENGNFDSFQSDQFYSTIFQELGIIFCLTILVCSVTLSPKNVHERHVEAAFSLSVSSSIVFPMLKSLFFK